MKFRSELVIFVAGFALLAGACAGDSDSSAPSNSEDGSSPSQSAPDETVKESADFNDLSLNTLDVEIDYPTDVSVNGETPFVAQRSGKVWALTADGDDYTKTEVLDIEDEVGSTDVEKGLLGVAVAPDGESMFLNYTRADDGATVIEEYRLTGDTPSEVTAESTGSTVIIEQPFPNHNGGDLAFGPDGMLYVGTGDGGSADDPDGRAQRLDTNLGKILRLDPSQGDLQPEDNPYDSLIWIRGARNPWRISFDSETGDLWVADVGQNRWEEINMIPAGTGSGADLGWDKFEGTEEFEGVGPTEGWPDDDAELVDPIHVYSHDDGRCSVSGGYVVRGGETALEGLYLFSDFCDGEIWATTAEGAAANIGLQIDGVLSINPDEQGRPLVLTPDGISRIQ